MTSVGPERPFLSAVIGQVGIGAEYPAGGGSYATFEVVAGNEYELVAS